MISRRKTDATQPRSLWAIGTSLLLAGLLAYTTPATADQRVAAGSSTDTAKPFPSDGVLFGRPPGPGEAYFSVANRGSGKASVVAEFDVSSGFVRFIDEGGSIATVVKGDSETFRIVGAADTIGELFEIVTSGRSEMPRQIAAAESEPFDALHGSDRSVHGQTLEEELIVGQDPWADGCDDGEFAAWEDNFVDWHGFFPYAGDRFSTSDHYLGATPELSDLHGYFRTMDEIWFGVCPVAGLVTNIEMERRVWDFGSGGEYGNWELIPGTAATLSVGERYLYHNHTIYGPYRRSTIIPIGNSDVTGWEYFISGAANDSFAPDDQMAS